MKTLAGQHLAQGPREVGGDNRGPWVRAYMGGQDGKWARWCAGFVSTLLAQGCAALKIQTPYVLAMIELEEGPRMMSNLINVAPDPKVVRCDMPVQVVFHKLTEDMTISLWEPATGGAR